MHNSYKLQTSSTCVFFVLLFIFTYLHARTTDNESEGAKLLASKVFVNVLIAENWDTAKRELERIAPTSSSSVAKLLSGHINYGLQNYNEAASVFFGITDSSSLESWKSWTKELMQATKNSAISDYLHADAQGRIGEIDSAMHFVNKALSIDPDFCLAYNLRGVLDDIQGRLNPDYKQDGNNFALTDFELATECNPNFMDAFLNKAIVNLQLDQKEQAIELVDSVLIKTDSTHALALNTAACFYLIENKPDKAEESILKAIRFLPNNPFVIGNALTLYDSTAILTPNGEVVASDSSNRGVSASVQGNVANIGGLPLAWATASINFDNFLGLNGGIELNYQTKTSNSDDRLSVTTDYIFAYPRNKKVER